MKNILVLFGSPHKNGKTQEVLNSFLAQFSEDSEVKAFSAFQMNVKPCVDCGYCKKISGCIERDLDDFIKCFEEADIFVIASPVYNFSFPAPVKSILDRFQRYFNARFSRNEKPPIKKAKQAVLLMTCGSVEESGFEICVHQLNRIFTVLNTNLVSTVLVSGTDSDKKKFSKNDVVSAFEKLNLR